jgi:septal ring factor EnvC (AmiA/AmiB activator)
MRMRIFPLLIFVLASVISLSAQADRAGYPPPQQPPVDAVANISMELTNISRSVQQLSERLKAFVDKFEKVGGLTLTEKQQRFIMGLEILVRSEQRVATLQKLHTDLIEKHIQVKTRLTQIELDLRPQSIERTTQLEGSTQTVEIRETRREKLIAEQRSLQQLIQQVERNIADADAALREAQAHVNRLRRSLLPQIEREINESSF